MMRVLWLCVVVLLFAIVPGRDAPGEEPALRDDFSAYAAESDGSPRWLVQDGVWHVLGGVYEQSDPRRRGVVAFSAGPAFGDMTFTVRFRIEPFGVGAMLSRDGGGTWDAEHRVMIAWDSQSTDTGYPSAVQLDDGTLIVLYYAVGTHDLLPQKQQCVCLRFAEEQIVAAGSKGQAH